MPEPASATYAQGKLIMAVIILDPQGNAPQEAGYRLIEDDIALLRGVLEGENLFVRGERLCNWASQIAFARDMSQVWRKSPAQELAEDGLGISVTVAGKYLASLGDRASSLPRPVKVIDVVKSLWPDHFLWEQGPSARHAFHWLLWCIETSPTNEDSNLLQVWREKWLVDAAPTFDSAYKVIFFDDAWATLQKWLGLVKSNKEFPPPPAQLPSQLLKKLEDDWLKQLVKSDGAYFTTILDLNPSRQIASALAQLTCSFFTQNPAYFTKEYAQALAPYLNFADHENILNLLPPDDPGLPPHEFDQLVRWFKNAYLPYRIKSASSCDSRTREIARQFASWFLEFYAKARTGADGAEYMSWCRTARLAKECAAVTLLVVLDGLGFRDGEYLAKVITNKSQRVEIDEIDVIVSPLPTVTCLAKPALFTGFHPTCALEEDRIGPVERKSAEVIKTLNGSAPGDIVIWSILEPDHTYHHSSDPDSIRSEVDGWLLGFGGRLVDVMHLVSDTKNLRVVITTDHGRLLSSAKRLHPVPDGMEAHGRVAWGNINFDFDEKGFFIDGNIAYLHPGRFGTPEVCGLLLNDDAFYTANGRSGIEYFPHGGVFPEEVLIPWIQLSRDRKAISIEVVLRGTGIAKSNGRYVLEILNTSQVRINLLEMEIPSLSFKVPLRFEVPPLNKRVSEIPVTYWPTTSESQSVEAIIVYSLPTGERKTVRIKPELIVEEMYQQEDILSDL